MLARAFIMLGLAVLAIAPLEAADFCAVTLHVVSPEGEPAGAHVSVKDDAGKVVLETLSYRDPVEICDLGFGLHSISIESAVKDAGRCYPTTISNVRVENGTPLVLRAVVNPCAGGPGWGLVNACSVYLRIRSESGPAISNVILTATPSMIYPADLKPDSYGRVWFYMSPAYPTVTITIAADEFEPASVGLECRRSNERVEREIVLERAN